MITREDIRELAEFQGRRRGLRDQFLFSAGAVPTTSRTATRRFWSRTWFIRPCARRRKTDATGPPGLTCKRFSSWREIGRETGRGPRQCLPAAARSIWREFDLPPQLAKTQLFVNRRFHLKELAVVLGAQPRLRVVLLDRHRARFFDLHLDEVKEGEALFRPLPRRGRGDGFGGLTPATPNAASMTKRCIISSMSPTR